MGETNLLIAIHDAIALTGKCLLWRNNTGQHGRVRFGLGVGGADLVGLVRPNGRWFALEVKTPSGRLSKVQKNWAAAVTDAGGFVACVRSVDEALAALEEAMR
jgi:hypothetical protein